MNEKIIIANILRLYAESTKQEKVDGLEWYIKVNKIVLKLADKYGIAPEKVAGIISALSPATNFEQNLKDAENLIKNMTAGRPDKVHVTTYGNNKLKAIDIFKLTDISQIEAILVGSSRVVNKTYSFYVNIASPELCSHVTIDRHAIRIALDEILNGTIILTEKRYRIIRDAYIKAAKKLEIRPHELQAITWLTFKRFILEMENIPF